MRRPAVTLVFLGLAALVLTEGFVVFRFLKNAADATQLVAVERQLAHEASGLTRRVIAQTRARDEKRAVALEDEEAETPRGTPGVSAIAPEIR